MQQLRHPVTLLLLSWLLVSEVPPYAFFGVKSHRRDTQLIVTEVQRTQKKRKELDAEFRICVNREVALGSNSLSHP